MASSVTKQQYYRRLMKEQKSKAASSQQSKKITHPLARYNVLDQLTCVLCNVQVKSDILWNTHLQSRKHKECVNALKTAKPQTSNVPSTSSLSGEVPRKPKVDGVGCVAVPTSAGGKRKLPGPSEDNSEDPTRKKKSKRRRVAFATPADTKSGLPAGFFDSDVKKKFHPRGEEVYYESSDSDEEEGRVPSATTTTSNANAANAAAKEIVPSSSQGMAVPVTPSNVPADFFDRGSENTPESKGGGTMDSKALPKGFFDDPKQDAKARHVEYKDPMTEQWERFQKSIQKEDDISEVILFEGDEEAMEEREVEEVNQQVHCFTKAEDLRQQHEKLLVSRAQQQTQNSTADHDKMSTESQSSGEEEEADFDEFLNWRAKMS